MQRLPSVDGYFSALIARLRSEGKVLRFAADLAYDGAITVGPVEVPAQTPLAAIKGGENAFVFTTRYYSPNPAGNPRVWCRSGRYRFRRIR
jgi:aspartokinase/homoserine dehydrogenase 1